MHEMWVKIVPFIQGECCLLLLAELERGVCISLSGDALMLILWLRAGKAELNNETSNSF